MDRNALLGGAVRYATYMDRNARTVRQRDGEGILGIELNIVKKIKGKRRDANNDILYK